MRSLSQRQSPRDKTLVVSIQSFHSTQIAMILNMITVGVEVESKSNNGTSDFNSLPRNY